MGRKKSNAAGAPAGANSVTPNTIRQRGKGKKNDSLVQDIRISKEAAEQSRLKTESYIFGIHSTETDLYDLLSFWKPLTIGLFVLVILLAFGTRFYKVDQPPQVLFDEVHFVSMAQWYAARKYFFDIHPPVGKLCLAAIAHLTGFHTDEPYRDIGKPYEHEGYVMMRYWQAFWGSTVPIVCFCITFQLTRNPWSSFMVGLLVVFELSLQTISRAILLDSFLHATFFLSLLLALYVWEENEKIYRNTRKSSLPFWSWTLLCSLCMAVSFGTKHTALGIIGVIGLIQIIKCFAPVVRYFLFLSRTTGEDFAIFMHASSLPTKRKLQEWVYRMFISGIVMIFFIVILHVFFFYLHFVVIERTGVDEDSMSDNYRSQLIGSEIPMPAGEEPQGMWKNIVDINIHMQKVNAAVSYTGYYISPWYEWPIMWTGVMYEWESFDDGTHAVVYLFGNPIIYWLVLAGALVGLFYGDRKMYASFNNILKPVDRHIAFNLGLCLLGYFANILPYPLLIARPCYLYHYHPSLIFGILLLGVLQDCIAKKVAKQTSLSFCFFILAASFAAYLHFLPFSYFIPMTDAEHDARRWFALFSKW